MTTHEKAQQGHRSIGLLLTQDASRFGQVSDIVTLIIGRAIKALPPWVKDNPEMLNEIQQCPRLLDCLLAEGFYEQTSDRLGWDVFSPLLPTTALFLFGVKHWGFDNLKSLPNKYPLDYIGSFSRWIEGSDGGRKAAQRPSVSKDVTTIVRMEVLLPGGDMQGRQETHDHFRDRPRLGTRPLLPLSVALWLALNRLPRLEDQRYFFLAGEGNQWGYCQWKRETWCFHDGYEGDPKGERLRTGDRLLLCEGMYRP